jgi:hypothetical protein
LQGTVPTFRGIDAIAAITEQVRYVRQVSASSSTTTIFRIGTSVV